MYVVVPLDLDSLSLPNDVDLHCIAYPIRWL